MIGGRGYISSPSLFCNIIKESFDDYKNPSKNNIIFYINYSGALRELKASQ